MDTGSSTGNANDAMPTQTVPESPGTTFDASELKLQPLSPELMEYFAQRKITPATLQRNGVMQTQRFSHKDKISKPFIAFPFYRNGEIVNVKYRSLDKEFSQVRCDDL